VLLERDDACRVRRFPAPDGLPGVLRQTIGAAGPRSPESSIVGAKRAPRDDSAVDGEDRGPNDGCVEAVEVATGAEPPECCCVAARTRRVRVKSRRCREVHRPVGAFVTSREVEGYALAVIRASLMSYAADFHDEQKTPATNSRL